MSLANRLSRVTHLKVVRYPIVEVTFDDGFRGEVDFSDTIARGDVMAPLRDPAYFATISIDEHGHKVGWRLDDMGNELDFGAGALRRDAEDRVVALLAASKHRPAAE